MWVFYTTLVIFILLTGYFFTFPLYKKRPVLIKKGGLIVYSLSLVTALFPFLGIWNFIIVIAVILILYFLNPWFVYGVTDAMLFEALEKAALATRAPFEKLDNKYKIDDSMEIRPLNLAGKTSLILFKNTSDSKRAKLTVVVFKKFIQNYFI
jgi:hypothetical protein